MTSRRGLMKLLAALPFAAPVVAKEVAAAQFTGASVSTLNVYDEVIWTGHGGFGREIRTIRNAKPGLYHCDEFTQFIHEDGTNSYGIGDVRIGPPDVVPPTLDAQPNEALCALLCAPARSDTPNRLYGVRINSDGDAV